MEAIFRMYDLYAVCEKQEHYLEFSVRHRNDEILIAQIIDSEAEPQLLGVKATDIKPEKLFNAVELLAELIYTRFKKFDLMFPMKKELNSADAKLKAAFSGFMEKSAQSRLIGQSIFPEMTLGRSQCLPRYVNNRLAVIGKFSQDYYIDFTLTSLNSINLEMLPCVGGYVTPTSVTPNYVEVEESTEPFLSNHSKTQLSVVDRLRVPISDALHSHAKLVLDIQDELLTPFRYMVFHDCHLHTDSRPTAMNYTLTEHTVRMQLENGDIAEYQMNPGDLYLLNTAFMHGAFVTGSAASRINEYRGKALTCSMHRPFSEYTGFLELLND